jgi:hypothetical protein
MSLARSFALADYVELLVLLQQHGVSFRSLERPDLRSSQMERAHYLRHLIAGDIRSALAMAEAERRLGIVATYFVAVPKEGPEQGFDWQGIETLRRCGHAIGLQVDGFLLLQHYGDIRKGIDILRGQFLAHELRLSIASTCHDRKRQTETGFPATNFFKEIASAARGNDRDIARLHAAYGIAELGFDVWADTTVWTAEVGPWATTYTLSDSSGKMSAGETRRPQYEVVGEAWALPPDLRSRLAECVSRGACLSHIHPHFYRPMLMDAPPPSVPDREGAKGLLGLVLGLTRKVRPKAGPRAAEPGTEVAATAPSKVSVPRPPEPAIFASVFTDCGHCTSVCKASQDEWQDWFKLQFHYQWAKLEQLQLSEADLELYQAQKSAFGGRESTTVYPLAILDVGAGHEAYWQRIGPKGRNMVRKAEKAGYGCREFAWNDHLHDIHAVNISMPERGGRPMHASYLEWPAPATPDHCALQGRRYFGAFLGNTLVAYIKLVVWGHFSTVLQILGHGAHLHQGIMNAAMNFLAKTLCEESKIGYVNYLTLRGSRDSLDSFKKRLGFDERTTLFLCGSKRADALDAPPTRAKIDRLPVKQPFELVRTQKSAFRSLLCLLPLHQDAVVVDVGAGGLTGANTTDHIVDLLGGRVIAIEMDAAKSQAVAQKYGSRVESVHAEYGKYGVSTPFDLIVMDLSPPSSSALESLADFAVSDGLRPGGFVIALLIYDTEAALKAGAKIFDPAAVGVDAQFNRRFFGAERVDAATLAKTYARHPQLEFVTLADKWFGEGVLGQVVLRRRGARDGLPENGLHIPQDLTDTQNSGFRTFMAMLAPDRGHVIAEVEEAGHFGETTRHILDHHLGETICFRAAKAQGDALRQRFGDRVNLVAGRYGKVGCRRPFDAIVFGLAGDQVPAIFDELLGAAIRDGLKPGGYAVCGLVHDADAAFAPATGYFPTSKRDAYAAFMTGYFGAQRLSAPVLEAKFRDHHDFEFVGLLDRWLDTGNRGLGWLVLRRRG